MNMHCFAANEYSQEFSSLLQLELYDYYSSGVFMCFFNKWIKEHIKVLDAFSSVNLNDKWEEMSGYLTKYRERSVSALVQGLRREYDNDTFYQKIRSLVVGIIAAHDRIFIKLLNIELSKLRTEVSQTLSSAKAIGAYSQSARTIGDAILW